MPDPTPPQKRNTVLIIGFIIFFAGMLLLVIPVFFASKSLSSPHSNPVTNPAAFADEMSHTAGGVMSTVMYSMVGIILAVFGFIIIVISKVGGIFTNIFGGSGTQGLMGQLISNINKRKHSGICPSCGARNDVEAKVCNYCKGPL